MKKFLLIAFIGLASVFANAQIPTSGNVFFGYSYSGGDVDMRGSGLIPQTHTTNLNGWEGSLEGKFLPWVGLVADLAGQYGSHQLFVCSPVTCTAALTQVSASRYTAMFGPRVSVSVWKLTPFAQALVGAAHVSDTGGGRSTSDTSFSTAIGGGIDYKLFKGVAWRFQGDSLHTWFYGGSQNHVRLSTGLVLRF